GRVGVPVVLPQGIGHPPQATPAAVVEVLGDGLDLDPAEGFAQLAALDVPFLLLGGAMGRPIVLDAHFPCGPREIRFAEIPPLVDLADVEIGLGKPRATGGEAESGLGRRVAAYADQVQRLAQPRSAEAAERVHRDRELVESGVRVFTRLSPFAWDPYQVISDIDELSE